MEPPLKVRNYIPSDTSWHKEQEYIQLRGEEFNGFQDIRKTISYRAPLQPPGMMTCVFGMSEIFVWNWAFWAHWFLRRSLKYVAYISKCKNSFLYCGPTRLLGDMILRKLLLYYVRLIIYGFTSPSRICHLYGDVTFAGEGLQNLGLCSALRAFEQGGIFIVPHLLRNRASIFPASSEGPPHSVASYDTREGVEDLF
jgi:hypothetical protein